MKRAIASSCYITLGCCTVPAPTVDDVITRLSFSPPTLVADGHALTVLTVCSVDEGVKSDLKVHLSLNGARWWRPTDTTTNTLERVLGRDGCTEMEVIAPRTLGPVRAWAEIEGFDRSVDLALVPATVDDLVLSLDGQIKAGEISQVQVTARALVNSGGEPSVGTVIGFKLSATPSGAAYLTRDRVVLDATAEEASVEIVTASDLTSLTIDGTAVPPGASAATATETLVIPVLE